MKMIQYHVDATHSTMWATEQGLSVRGTSNSVQDASTTWRSSRLYSILNNRSSFVRDKMVYLYASYKSLLWIQSNTGSTSK